MCVGVYVCCFERKQATFLNCDETAAFFVYAAAIQITEEIPYRV